MRLTVAIDPGSKPISGTITRHGEAAPREFCGWLELTEALEGARISQGEAGQGADGGVA